MKRVVAVPKDCHMQQTANRTAHVWEGIFVGLFVKWRCMVTVVGLITCWLH